MRKNKAQIIAAIIVMLVCQIFMGSLAFAADKETKDAKVRPAQYSSITTAESPVNLDGYLGAPRESEMSLSLEQRLQSKNRMMEGVECTFEYRGVWVTFGQHMQVREREEVLKVIDYAKDNYEPLWGTPVKNNTQLRIYFPSFVGESLRYISELYTVENGYSEATLLKEARYIREHGKEEVMAYTLSHNTGTSIVVVDSKDIYNFKGIVFHEMTHYYQRTFGGLKNSSKVQWFKEGQASYNEDVIFADGSIAYHGIFNDSVSNYRSLMQLSVAFSSAGNEKEDVTRTYNLSYNAVKYLGEAYGQQKLIDFNKYLSANPSLTMAQSLKTFFGISIEDLNRIAMQAVARNQNEVNNRGFRERNNFEYH